MSVKPKSWLLQDGSPKPEYKLELRTPLSDGTRCLILMEPNVKSIRRATKLLEYRGLPDANGDRDLTSESGLAFGICLISGVTGIAEEIIEELPQTAFKAAVEYLQSFA